MMINEFEKLTGVYPTADLYTAIEAAYYEFDGDKVAFCKAYAANTDGIAEKIRDSVNAAAVKAQSEHAAELTRKDIQIDALTKQVEREQEWKPYVDTNNYQQAEYDHLRSAGRVMTDDEATGTTPPAAILQKKGAETMTTKIIAKIEEMQCARISKGWSCARLGRESGVTGQSIIRIERGDYTSPSTAKKIADTLGLPVNDLFKIEQKSKGKEE